jgi:hypothetical protein
MTNNKAVALARVGEGFESTLTFRPLPLEEITGLPQAEIKAVGI